MGGRSRQHRATPGRGRNKPSFESTGEVVKSGIVNTSGEGVSVYPAIGQQEAEIAATPPDIVGASAAPVAVDINRTVGSERRVSASLVADRLLDLCVEHGDPITNLKLQKLLYYAQAWYLAFKQRRLFPDRFEAWIHGPAQPEVFARFTQFGSQPIDQPVTEVSFPPAIESHLSEVLAAYGSLSAFDLERLTQQELPWQQARGGRAPDEPSTAVIDIIAMKKFYKAKADEQAKKGNPPTADTKRKDRKAGSA